MEPTRTFSNDPFVGHALHREAIEDPAFRVKTVAVCDSQPIISEGVRMLLFGVPDLHFLGSLNSLAQAVELVRSKRSTVLLLDKAFGVRAIEAMMLESRASPRPSAETEVIVWGTSVVEAEACRLLQAGAKCVLQKTIGPQDLVECIRAVSTGREWTGGGFRMPEGRINSLTRREHQVIDLLERQYSNKAIAQEMGIGIGTVKVHLKNIFHKTGIHSRFGLALSRSRTDDARFTQQLAVHSDAHEGRGD
jgi:DNA-binding NarL/FixJ family response regulator